MLDRTKNQFSGLDLETLKASEPPLGAPFQDHVDWICAMGRLCPQRHRVIAPVHVGDSYENVTSADCEDWGL
jgi:hypothetical protein